MTASTARRVLWIVGAMALAGCSAAGAEADAGADADVPIPDGSIEADLFADEIYEPQNVHATWQRSPESTLTFTWRTFLLDDYAPKVWLAPAALCAGTAEEPSLPIAGSTTLTGLGRIYTAEGGIRTAWFAEATGLAPDTEYVYRVGSWDAFDPIAGPQGGRLGPPRRARTAPAPGSHAPFTFAVAGDTQGALADLAAHAEAIAETPAAFWLLTGDMTSSSSQKNWNPWFHAFAPVLDRAVVMPVRGNHEVSYGTFYGQFPVPVEPDLPWALLGHAWSFDYGNAHVVGLDATVAVEVEPIAAWLDADLAAAAADPGIDWKIVFFHYPAYSASTHGCTARVLDHWAPVLEARGVDLVFSGHDHDYERTWPIAGSALAAPGAGVTYVVTGGFFTSLYPARRKWWTARSAKFDNFVVVAVDGEQLRLEARNPNNQKVIDEAQLSK
jgi:hypothetical protein